MPPKRSNSSRSRRASDPKPYARPVVPDATSIGIAQQEIATISRPGFPTRAQYKHIETVYVNSLSPQRKEKALISQHMFDRIWDVLQNKDKSPEDGQFKFWVRRNFVFGTFNKASLDSGILARTIAENQVVVLHEGALVALQEQMYDLLCYAHGSVNHGGRDKTLAAIRKFYTWVPKELVGQFTISCPTCMMKKAGLSKKRLKDGGCTSNESHLPALHNFLSNVAAQEGYDIGNNGNDWLLARGPTEDHGSTSIRVPAASTSANRSPSVLPSSPQSLPMSREVSLYHGLPNGWQFRTDYPTAYAEFMKRKNEGTLNPPDTALGKKRPRIPSVAPLIGPDYIPQHDNISDEDLCLGKLPAMMRHPTCDGDSAKPGSLPPDFQSFRAQLQESFLIDPALLATAPSLNVNSSISTKHSPRLISPEPEDKEHDMTLRSPKCNSGVHRVAAPPRLNLACLNSVEAIEAFLAHRNARNMSPHSQLSQTPLDSPASSVGSSCSSQLSAFPTMTTSCSSAVTSALPTPVDDEGAGLDVRMDKLGTEMADGAKGMGLTSSLSDVSTRATCHEVVV